MTNKPTHTDKMLAKDPEYFSRIGKIGAAARKAKQQAGEYWQGGFSDKDFARRMGKIGGIKSRRGRAKGELS